MSIDQPRTPAGSPTGGQFAGTDRPEADVTLTQPPAGRTEALLRRFAAAHRRVLARQRAPMGEGGLDEMVALRLSGLAAGVRATHPAAASFRLEVSDQPGGEDDWGVVSVSDAAGLDLTEDVDVFPDDLVDDAWYLGYDMPGHRIEAHPAASDYDERRGLVTIGVDAALAAGAAPLGTPSEVVQRATARGSALIETYQSQHDDLDAEPETVAADLLGDLHQWARASGVDLDAAFERGRRYADDETAEQALDG